MTLEVFEGSNDQERFRLSQLQGVSVAGVGTVLSEIPWPWYVGLDPTKTS